MNKLEGFGEGSAIGSKRRASRASTFLQAEIRIEGRAPVTLRVRNLSAGGMMLQLDPPPPVGTAIDASLRGVGLVTGRIAWVKPGRVGVSFDTLVDPALARRPVQRSVSSDRLVPPAKAPVRRPRIKSGS